MTYIIDDDGIHLIVPPEQPPRNPPANSVGCVFGSVTDAVLPIPLDEAVETCKQIAAEIEALG